MPIESSGCSPIPTERDEDRAETWQELYDSGMLGQKPDGSSEVEVNLDFYRQFATYEDALYKRSCPHGYEVWAHPQHPCDWDCIPERHGHGRPDCVPTQEDRDRAFAWKKFHDIGALESKPGGMGFDEGVVEEYRQYRTYEDALYDRSCGPGEKMVV